LVEFHPPKPETKLASLMTDCADLMTLIYVLLGYLIFRDSAKGVLGLYKNGGGRR
jgi:hypothetical protein